MKRFVCIYILGLAILAIALPAYAEVQNVKVSGDIDSKFVYRDNYDFRSSAKDTGDWFQTIARVRVDADLTDNVSATLRLLNERDWDVETSSSSDIDLDLAYVTIKEMVYSPLSLSVGRQNLRFGNALVVGDPDTNDATAFATITADDLSARKAFDAIRATLDYNPLTIDLVFAQVDENTTTANDDIVLWGANAGYKFAQYNAEAEAYWFTRYDRSSPTTSKSDETDVVGIRGSLEPITNLGLDGELAYQFGDFDTGESPSRKIDRRAWAVDVGGTYAFENTLSPKLGLRYSYRSGQKSPGTDANIDVASGTTGKLKSWDPMFEDQTHGVIANEIFDGINDGVDSNSHIINVNASIVPIKDLTLTADYYHYLLAEKFYSTGTSGGVNDRTLRGSTYDVKSKKDLGDELDLILNYDYTEDVNLGLLVGIFWPGSTFQGTNDKTASEVLAGVSVAF